MKFFLNVILPIIISILVFFVLLPVSKNLLPDQLLEQILFCAACSIICMILYLIFIYSNSISYIIRHVIIKAEINKHPILAITVIDILSRSDEVEFSFRARVEDWIHFLIAAVEPTKSSWFSTYLINIEDWESFADLATAYNDALKNKNIDKVRCVIQSLSSTTLDFISNSNLVLDSIESGINVPVYDMDKIKGIDRFKYLRDFALFDENFVIAGITNNKKLTRNSKVKIKILKGMVKIGPYLNCKKELLRENPSFTYKKGV